MNMKEKIEACFNRLQKLTIPVNVTNTEILLQTFYDLRDIYNALENKEREEMKNADNGTDKRTD